VSALHDATDNLSPVRRTSFSEMPCSIARTLEVVGEWWTLLIVRDAFLGVTRFDDWQARLGIARNVLTARLDRLVHHGILERRRYQERPPRDEYVLTDKGRDLGPVLGALRVWGDTHAPLDDARIDVFPLRRTVAGPHPRRARSRQPRPVVRPGRSPG
jgi:DNA-binding HxlR family transcriptional regulator